MTTTPATIADLASLFLDSSQRDVEPRQGQIGHTSMAVRSVDEEKRQVHFLCSTGQIDRYGEVVDPEALKAAVPDFMKNPVFVAGHVYSTPNGEPTVIGHWSKLWVSKDGLEGIVQFDDEDPLALRYWNHFRKGNMRAVSIGFKTRAWEMREFKGDDGQARRVRVFTQLDLLEISAVTIPANPAALIRAASAFALQPGEARHTDAQGEATVTSEIRSIIKQVLFELFTAGTEVSFTRTLALEIADVMRSCQNQGGGDYFGDFHEDEDESDPSTLSQDTTSIKDILREILPA